MLTARHLAGGAEPAQPVAAGPAQATAEARRTALAIAGRTSAPTHAHDPWRSAMLRVTGEALCGVDHDGRITFANPALGVLSGREGERLEGQRLHDLVHREAAGAESHRAEDCPFLGRRSHPASATDTEFRRGDGSLVTVGYRRMPVADGGEGEQAILSLRDVTRGRTAAALLRFSLKQVETLDAERAGLLESLAEVEDRERGRLAAELHDDPIQALDALALRLSSIGEQAQDDSQRDVLAEVEIQVRAVAERLRRIMFELTDPMSGRNLRAGIEAYCATVFEDSPVSCELDGDGDVATLPPELARLAYRLIQEAVRNVRKHASASRIRISLHEDERGLLITVSDDGIGLVAAPAEPTHAGLRIVRDRAHGAGGRVRLGPGLDGRGVTVELWLPIARGAAS